jgi:hypothetical protein
VANAIYVFNEGLVPDVITDLVRAGYLRPVVLPAEYYDVLSGRFVGP